MTVYRIVTPGRKHKLTKEQIEELKALKDRTPEPDEDSPAYSYDELVEMRQAYLKRQDERHKQVLAIRVTPETMRKARALGKGYTGILSRLLELALNDPEMVKKAL